MSSTLESLRVLIVPDKFKGTLTAQAAARAIAAGWRRSRPRDRLELLPMSDGGDGFSEVMSGLLDTRPVVTETIDAAGRPRRCAWGWNPDTRMAVVESARVIGLAMLPRGEYHPYDLDTRGLGRLLVAVAQRGCGRCLVGLGGSATNDGGFGVARAWGWRFLRSDGKDIERWPELSGLRRIHPPRSSPLRGMRVLIAVDVQNRLLGPRGASRVYGPQKGLRPEDLAPAEKALRRLAAVAALYFGEDLARAPGAGAAGGLGFGLLAFGKGRLLRGSELFARHARLNQRLATVDLVVTGEGALDRSSLMGKGVGEVARRCGALGVPCLGLAGTIGDEERLRRFFCWTYAVVPRLALPEAAKSQAAHWLARLAANAARELPQRIRGPAAAAKRLSRTWNLELPRA